MRESNELLTKLYTVIASIETADDCKKLLEDLCTFKELEQMAQRLRAAELLSQGQTYAQVIADTDISSATLSRVSKCLRRGTGGYAKLLDNQNDIE